MIRRAPSQRTAGLITGMTGYRETALGRFSQREAAHLIVPLIISLGSPFLIALGASLMRPTGSQASPRASTPALFISSPMAGPNACRWISRRSAPIASSAAPSSILPRAWSTCQTCSAARAGNLRERLGATAVLATPLRPARGLHRRPRQSSAVTGDRLRLSPAGAVSRAARGSRRWPVKSAGAASIWSSAFDPSLASRPNQSRA